MIVGGIVGPQLGPYVKNLVGQQNGTTRGRQGQQDHWEGGRRHGRCEPAQVPESSRDPGPTGTRCGSALGYGFMLADETGAAGLTATEGQDPAVLYLDLLEHVLLRYGAFAERFHEVGRNRSVRSRLARSANSLLRRQRFALVREASISRADRYAGRDWPPDAESMIGCERMRNIRHCAADVLARNIDGDFVEAGVWRGGSTIYMRAILAAYGDRTRCVWAFDSFEGVPRPSGRYSYIPDDSDGLWQAPLDVSIDVVRENFDKYGLLDERVHMVRGWFSESLPVAEVERIALLRLDGDLYESTMDALIHLYPKVCPGGYVIIDDYFHIDQCRAAVDDYRREHGVKDDLHRVDWNAGFWQRA